MKITCKISKNVVKYTWWMEELIMKIIIDEYIESLKQRQASQNTLASYQRDLIQFNDYFE